MCVVYLEGVSQLAPDDGFHVRPCLYFLEYADVRVIQPLILPYIVLMIKKKNEVDPLIKRLLQLVDEQWLPLYERKRCKKKNREVFFFNA